MRNRAIQVKMVKTENKNETDEPVTEAQFVMKAAVISSYIKDGVKVAGKMALAYVLVDTFRQVAIEKAKK